MKPGRDYLDPYNRTVYLVKVEGTTATVRFLDGSGVTVQYPVSVLREVKP